MVKKLQFPNLGSIKPSDLEVFRNGYCHLIALQNMTNLGLKPISVEDMDYNPNEDRLVPVLTHTASYLPNGQIIDSHNIYQNEQEFLDCIEYDYEELDEFKVRRGNEALPLLMQVNNQTKSIPLTPQERAFLHNIYPLTIINILKQLQATRR